MMYFLKLVLKIKWKTPSTYIRVCISWIWSFEDTESVVKAALWMKSSRLLMVFLPFSADVKCHQGSQFRVKWPDRRCVQNSNIWRFRRHLALGHDRIGLGGELYLLRTFLARQLAKWYQQVWHFHHFNLVEFVFQPPTPSSDLQVQFTGTTLLNMQS